MNQCNFLGNLCNDPELRSFQSGKQKVEFTLAVGRSYKRGEERVNETAFLRCEAWDARAETIVKYFKKGSRILITASVKEDKWEDKNTGEKRSALKFNVTDFYFVDRKKDEGSDEPQAVTVGESDDQIPF